MAYERYPRGRSRDDDAAARDYGSGRDDFGERGYYSRNRMQDYGARGYDRDDQYRGGYGGYTGNPERNRDRDDRPRDGREDGRDGARGYGRQPQGYDYEERTFFDRAGDEVRSWFGDDEAERRRVMDQRNDERHSRDARDDHYHSWRASQIAALDRDYDDYRRENQQRFSNEFSSWRQEREGQRSSLSRVAEHMDVVGADGVHIGTVDKVRGDRIVLTKSDAEAGGRHHSIPSRWIDSVDDKVTVRKTADEAKAHWRDEERGALFGDDRDRDEDSQGRILNRSFSGTY